ncbi:MAG: site-2 protease family protein [Pyrobaculum sp.]
MFDREVRMRELVDMAVSLAVLTLGFSISLSGRGIAGGINWAKVIYLLPYIAFVLLFAFLGHELAHRQVARRLGYYAMYQADYTLLPLAVIFPLLFGFIFAAPGAVVISSFRLYGRGDERRDVFFISAAGPLSNIAFAVLGTVLYEATASQFWRFFAYINAWLALFNLLPIPPLDGSKMMRTKPAMWLPIIAVAALLVLWLW